MSKPQQQTPIEQLRHKRAHLEEVARLGEQQLGKHIDYIHSHAGSLLFSGLITLFFPTKDKPTNTPTNSVGTTPKQRLELSDYLGIVQGILPVAWEIVRPMLTAWSIQWIERKIFQRLFGQRKKGKDD